MIKKLLKKESGEGLISFLVTMVLLVGTIAFLITFFILNVNQFRLENTLNTTLKSVQVQGYLSPALKSSTESKLLGMGFASASVTSPQGSEVDYGGEIEITIAVSTLDLPSLDQDGHSGNSSTILRARGYIISQYMP
ncbi:MAG: hypothetical protein AB7G87_01325 [Clostridia bacterium]